MAETTSDIPITFDIIDGIALENTEIQNVVTLLQSAKIVHKILIYSILS